MSLSILEKIKSYDGPPLRIMEVCGTHTHAISEYGIRAAMPKNIRLISGPGCPVCVTRTGYIDEAIELAKKQDVIICTFGDLIRVPGTQSSLADARAKGATVKMVYSPLDAYCIARDNPNFQVIFLSVGFETTTPASCLALKKAAKDGLCNFSLLTANKTMDNAYRALKGSADAFLYPGHVSAITGMGIYNELKNEGISGAVAGFGPDDILYAIMEIIEHTKKGVTFAINCYKDVVSDTGNAAARGLICEMMSPCDDIWRGIGKIAASGLRLKDEYCAFDARKKFALPEIKGRENPLCRCGDVLMGRITPKQCPVFGRGCTPEHPIGACMVSSEGACAAYYKYAI